MSASYDSRVRVHLDGTSDRQDEISSLVLGDVAMEFRTREDAVELVEKRGARHDRDSALQRQLDEASRNPSGVDRCRDEDVRVEDDPEHLGGSPAGSLGSQSPQLLNGECHCLFLTDRHVVGRLCFRNVCEDGETAKPEVAAKGLLNNLCFKPPLCPSSATQCVENPLIEFDRRRPARHADKCRSVTRTRSRRRGWAGDRDLG